MVLFLTAGKTAKVLSLINTGWRPPCRSSVSEEVEGS
jgi:hypothetical protein